MNPPKINKINFSPIFGLCAGVKAKYCTFYDRNWFKILSVKKIAFVGKFVGILQHSTKKTAKKQVNFF